MSEAPRHRILHVDDDQMLLALGRQVLGACGFSVDTLNDPRELQDLSCAGYELVILDLVMPGIGGIELLEKIREAGYAGPALLLTSMELEREQRYQLKALAAVVMPKPFGPRHLIERIQEIMARQA